MSEIPQDFELVPCPNCGSERFVDCHEGRSPTIDADIVCRIVRCEDCGLHYTNPRPKLRALGRYYPDDYSPYQSEDHSAGAVAGREGSIKNLVLRDAFGAPSQRPTGFGRAVAKTISIFRRPESFGMGVAWRGRGRLLDFGCGSGKFLRRMAALGWDVTGIDFSEKAVNAVKASGLKAFQGTLPHPDLPAGSFDVVAMRHALEHVPDPRATLREAWKLLDAGGQGGLLIQVPNYDGWDVAYFKDASMGLDLPRHLTHFTPNTLRDMLEREGMQSVRVWQVTRSNWLRKAAKRSTGGGIIGRALRVSAMCRIAALMIQFCGRGNEIIATAVKG